MHYTTALVGNQQIQSYLQKTIKNGTVASAQAWFGPEHIGKTTFLINYIFALSCQQPTAKELACLKCAHCLALQREHHPNIVWLDAADKAVKFEAIRQARADSLHSTLYNGPRVLVIQNADRLSTAASNALLKLLEEPTAGLSVFLLATDPSRVLPTIASRCLTLNFSQVSPAELASGFKTATTQTLALAEGLPGKVQQFHEAPEQEAQWLKALASWVQIMQTTSTSERLQLAQPWLNQEKTTYYTLPHALQSLSLVLRDVLYVQTEQTNAIVAKPYVAALEKIAQQRSVTATLQALTKTQTLWQRQLITPVQKKLALTNLLLLI